MVKQRSVPMWGRVSSRTAKALAAAVVVGLASTACATTQDTSEPAGASGGTTATNAGSSETDASATDTVPIVIAASQGPVGAAFDVPAAEGAMLAVQEINDAGGFAVGDTTYTFQPIEVDITDNAAQGVSALSAAITENDPVAVFGPVLSSGLTASHVVTQGEEVLQFSPSTVGETLIGKPETQWLWKTLPNQPIYDGMAAYLTENVEGIDKAVVAEPDNATGQAAVETIGNSLEAVGIETAEVLYPEDLTNYAPVVDQILGEDPDFVIVGLTSAQTTAIMQALIPSSSASVFSGLGQAVDYPSTHDLGGTRWLSAWYPVDLGHPSTPELEDYAERLKAYLGTDELDPSLAQWSLTTYPYVYALVDAMKIAGTVTDTSAIDDALNGMTGKKVVNYSFDDAGQVTSDIQISEVAQGGELVDILTVSP